MTTNQKSVILTKTNPNFIMGNILIFQTIKILISDLDTKIALREVTYFAMGGPASASFFLEFEEKIEQSKVV